MEVSKISLKLWPDLTPMSTPRVQHEKEVRLIRYRSLPKGNNTIYHEGKKKNKKNKTEKSFSPMGSAVNDKPYRFLRTTWWLPDNCLMTAWQLSRAWRRIDNFLTTVLTASWRLPNKCVTTAWQVSVTTWQIPDKCLTIAWPTPEPQKSPILCCDNYMLKFE